MPLVVGRSMREGERGLETMPPARVSMVAALTMLLAIRSRGPRSTRAVLRKRVLLLTIARPLRGC